MAATGRTEIDAGAETESATTRFLVTSMLDFGRLLLRAVLAVVLFTVALSALILLSLVAMYSDRRVPE